MNVMLAIRHKAKREKTSLNVAVYFNSIQGNIHKHDEQGNINEHDNEVVKHIE